MTYVPGLVLALAAFWFALSGETAPLFLILGAVSGFIAAQTTGSMSALSAAVAA